MADTFNINDRSTWAWTDGGGVQCQPGDGPQYLLNPEDPGSFYQCTDGVPYKHDCPQGLVYNPLANPGPVCDWPHNVNESAVYDWAVKNGYVTDQR
jgi:hypothetical protein